jgi:formylglycine-generating enzyme required for sulfatase activity
MTFGPIATTTYTANGVTFHMARLPPGRFMDGDGRYRRELLVSRPLELGLTEVTQALWRAVMGSNPAQFKAEDQPVERVSSDDVQGFLARLSDLGLTGFRLPTEAEWAWAARCGAPTRWSGADRVKSVAIVEAKARQTERVARLRPGPSGLFDQSGNVSEWTADWYYGLSASGIDPESLNLGTLRIYCGGNWNDTPRHARITARDQDSRDQRYTFLGFRLLRTSS